MDSSVYKVLCCWKFGGVQGGPTIIINNNPAMPPKAVAPTAKDERKEEIKIE
jgi:hypothetical protein